MWQHYYRGKLDNVPHPHIMQDTLKYKSEQNTLEDFIRKRLVTTKSDVKTYISDILENYTIFFTKFGNNSRKLQNKSIIKSFIGSSIASMMHEDERRGYYLWGMRFLNELETPDKKRGERYIFLSNENGEGVPSKEKIIEKT
jgi:hypothetical protein